jgi:hypothetical protein
MRRKVLSRPLAAISKKKERFNFCLLINLILILQKPISADGFFVLGRRLPLIPF